MEDFKINADLEDDHKNTKDYNRFAKQLTGWCENEKIPDLASQDTRFTLEQQKKKLQSLGINMHLKFSKPNTDNNRVASISYGDRVFVNTTICARKHITTTVSDSQKEIYKSGEEGGLTIILQNPKKGSVPSPDTPMCCPNCGSPSTFGKLETGCEYCNTKFLMDELYPKVMHFFVDKQGKVLYDTKEIKKYIIVTALLFLPVFFILKYIQDILEPGSVSLIDYLYSVPGAAVIGVMFGTGAWFVANVIEAFRQMRNLARGSSTMVNSLVFCHKMKKIDPNFSTEYFRDKSTSLLKFMLYSKNPKELTICQCEKPIPAKLGEIIDVVYRNSGVNKYSIKDGVCNVALTFYTDSLHYRNGKIHRKSDKIRMSMRKDIKKPTDLSFSFKAVNCPSCGGSFDAENVRECPFCGNAYPLEENEWVVTDIRI